MTEIRTAVDSGETATLMSVPSSENFAAFEIRLRRTCLMRSASAVTTALPRSTASSVRSAVPASVTASRASPARSTSSSRSSTPP